MVDVGIYLILMKIHQNQIQFFGRNHVFLPRHLYLVVGWVGVSLNPADVIRSLWAFHPPHLFKWSSFNISSTINITLEKVVTIPVFNEIHTNIRWYYASEVLFEDVMVIDLWTIGLGD
jgi:hypothetical protein